MKLQIRYISIISIIFSLLLVFPDCGKKTKSKDYFSFYEKTVDTSKPIAVGGDRDIHVFCDNNNWQMIEEDLKSVLEQKIKIVSEEQYFGIIKADLRNIEELSKFKNLLFIGELQSNGPVSKHISSTLPFSALQKIKENKSDMFATKNRWVKDQLVVYLVANDPAQLPNLIKQRGNKLYNLFLERLGDRLAYQAYLTKLIPDSFFEGLPYKLKIPENYRIYSNDRQNRFISLIYRSNNESRTIPDKYISVYYEAMPSNLVTKDWLLQKRKELAWKYYQEDEFDPSQIKVEQVSFGKYQALFMRGAWKNLKSLIGGGFQTYAFYDKDRKIAFLIDNVVYYPAGDKLPVLLELSRISQTFEVK